jgi:hypothetical protein
LLCRQRQGEQGHGQEGKGRELHDSLARYIERPVCKCLREGGGGGIGEDADDDEKMGVT